MKERTYIAIDLKSFYASVECIERGLDPLIANLVVADESRTEKTICLAVSPALKAYGIPGRARLFEVIEKVRQINADRRAHAPGHRLIGSSSDADALREDPSLALDYIVARPQMALYMKKSTEIYDIYLKYVAPENIHVYSIDEVFMDMTDHLRGQTPYDFASRVIRHVLRATGITATAGIGTNLYLCKIAMDVLAKHVPADQDGVRIAQLDEMSYRRELWEHRPITDFWRVGRGYARKLEDRGLYTMGDVAACSLRNEKMLYDLFGVNAELLIDHAWGWEPCTMADIKAYKPVSNSLSVGQVLACPYPPDKAKIVLREMTDGLVLDLLEKGLVTDQMVLTVCYDRENLTDPARRAEYEGPVAADPYGRRVPKNARGTARLKRPTSSERLIMDAVMELFERIVDHHLLVRRMYIAAGQLMREKDAPAETYEQLDLFTDPQEESRRRAGEEAERKKERDRQEAVLAIRRKFGKNALLWGTSLEEGATGRERNAQIGGHRA